jgi:hypothetical protein
MQIATENIYSIGAGLRKNLQKDLSGLTFRFFFIKEKE